MNRSLFAVGCLLVLLAAPARAQNFAPPKSGKPDAKKLQAITAKLKELTRELQTLRDAELILPDLEVYKRGVEMILVHDEFFQPVYADWCLEALEQGLERVQQAADGKFPWLRATGQAVVRGYRSRIDGSVQPYAVTLPQDYGKDQTRRPIHVFLHGRDTTLTEVKFLHQHKGDRKAPASQNYVRIDIFGRGNNAYRWAGEVDVYEALKNFGAIERVLKSDHLYDAQRVVLRGFSMGGAGTWHLGLHRPGSWFALAPGAGFTTTRGYTKLPEQMPNYQEKCLHIYDAVDYAENAFNIPIVAYSGADDAQKQAADNIEQRLRQLDLSKQMTHLIAPGLKHTFPADWQKKVEEKLAPLVARFPEPYPEHVRFTTWTMRYASCGWVTLHGLHTHYEQALVDAQRTDAGLQVRTKNVESLSLDLPSSYDKKDIRVTIDGQTLHTRPWLGGRDYQAVTLQQRAGVWQVVLPQRLTGARLRTPRKDSALCGPIDDAFTTGFLCVRGTGKPWHEATQRYAAADLERFRQEWGKYFRGTLPIKDDIDVTADDLRDKHLILFGDPAANHLIAQVLDGLPLQWTKEQITFAGKTYKSAEHVPALIYPSPLSPFHYVVLNSGHTFHAPEFRGTNALLYPRLGDYAVLQLAGTAQAPLAVNVATAGLFDETWQIR